MESILQRVPPEIVVHHDAFGAYIASQPPHNHRISMSLRKLSKFSLVHFIELSTDIYDELQRRADPISRAGEHLQSREDIHPKRNRARYQLGDLSNDRFGDMCKDLIAEHERRFPEFIQYEISKEEQEADATGQNAIPQTVYTATIEPTKSVMVEDDDGDATSDDDDDDDVRYSDYAPTPQIHSERNVVDNNSGEDEDMSFDRTNVPPVASPIATSGKTARVTILSPTSSPDLRRRTLTSDKDEQISDLIKECTRLESRVTELENDMTDLEAVKNAAVAENTHLHDMLSDSVAENEKKAQKIAQLEDPDTAAVVTKSKGPKDPNEPSYDELVEQLTEQQQVTEQVRKEASSFLEEMRALTEKRSQEDDQQRSLIQELRQEVEEWRSKYSQLAETMRQNGGIVAMPPLEVQQQYYDASGKISEAAVREFRSAVDTLVVEARIRPDNLLDLLHNVILATRRVSHEAGEQDVRYNTYTRLISRTANQLISVVRNMSVAGGLLPFLLLDAACSDLGFAVVELLRAAKIQSEPTKGGLRISMTPTTPLRVPSTSHTDTTERTSTTTPLSTGARASMSTPLPTTDAHISEPPVPNPLEPPSPEASPIESPDLKRTSKLKEYAVPTLPPDSSIAELQTYLEEQTSETVDSIQALLSGIRDNEKVSLLKPKVRQISVLVRKMLDATGTSMAQTRNWLLRDKGSFILQNLGDCSSRMEALYDELDRLDDETQAKRQLKQRLAGVSFDMAKSTKELVKTVEEVSIKSEIEQIDMQLGGA